MSRVCHNRSFLLTSALKTTTRVMTLLVHTTWSKLNTNLIKIPVPYRLPMGSWLGIGATTKVKCWWLRGVYRCCFWVGRRFYSSALYLTLALDSDEELDSRHALNSASKTNQSDISDWTNELYPLFRQHYSHDWTPPKLGVCISHMLLKLTNISISFPFST